MWTENLNREDPKKTTKNSIPHCVKWILVCWSVLILWHTNSIITLHILCIYNELFCNALCCKLLLDSLQFQILNTFVSVDIMTTWHCSFSPQIQNLLNLRFAFFFAAKMFLLLLTIIQLQEAKMCNPSSKTKNELIQLKIFKLILMFTLYSKSVNKQNNSLLWNYQKPNNFFRYGRCQSAWNNTHRMDLRCQREPVFCAILLNLEDIWWNKMFTTLIFFCLVIGQFMEQFLTSGNNVASSVKLVLFLACFREDWGEHRMSQFADRRTVHSIECHRAPKMLHTKSAIFARISGCSEHSTKYLPGPDKLHTKLSCIHLEIWIFWAPPNVLQTQQHYTLTWTFWSDLVRNLNILCPPPKVLQKTVHINMGLCLEISKYSVCSTNCLQVLYASSNVIQVQQNWAHNLWCLFCVFKLQWRTGALQHIFSTEVWTQTKVTTMGEKMTNAEWTVLQLQH